MDTEFIDLLGKGQRQFLGETVEGEDTPAESTCLDFVNASFAMTDGEMDAMKKYLSDGTAFSADLKTKLDALDKTTLDQKCPKGKKTSSKPNTSSKSNTSSAAATSVLGAVVSGMLVLFF